MLPSHTRTRAIRRQSKSACHHTAVLHANSTRPYFHPSLWLSESHDLLVSQCDHRIDSHGAAQRNKAGDQRDRDEGEGYGD